MNTQRPAILVAVVALIVTLILAGGAAAQSPGPGSSPQAIGPSALTGSGFTYQGWLLDGTGMPVTSTRTVEFGLFDGPDFGPPLAVITRSVTPDGQGWFGTSLDFGPDFYQGQALWLELKVAGDETGPLKPRQELAPVPYALGLRPGARIEGKAPLPVFSVANAEETPGNSAIFAVAGSPTTITLLAPAAVRGEARNGFGLSGISVNSVGVMGFSVMGEGGHFSTSSADPDAKALTGVLWSEYTAGNSTGVYGRNNGANGVGHGVWGDHASGGEGVLGTSNGGTGVMGYSAIATGVYGESVWGLGVHGRSISGTAAYFVTDNPDADAVVVDGRANVTGDLNVGGTVRSAAYGYASLPIAYGHVNDTGALASGTSNVSSQWMGADGYYAIAISGESYSNSDYVTQITLDLGCPALFTARTGNIGGNLQVVILNSSSGWVQCGFQFVTYKP